MLTCKVKLICFPYAGGASNIFYQWRNYITKNVIIKPIELSGRGKRINENMYADFDHLMQDVVSLVVPEIKNDNYVLFGHSMGAKIAFYLAQEIKRLKLREPLHLFISGRGAPGIVGRDEDNYASLSDKDFKNKIINLGGTSKEIFEHPELENIFLPLLRNDFLLAENDININHFCKLSYNISVFSGIDDILSEEQVNSWAKFSSKSCSISYFQGGHFFITENTREVVSNINRVIESLDNVSSTEVRPLRS